MHTQRQVVIKVFDKPDNFCGLSEINTTKYLKHDNIVKFVESGKLTDFIDDFGDFIDFNYLVTEYYSHGNLYDYVAITGRFSEPMARHCINQIATALHLIHKSNFAHRDLKLENIVMDANFNLKLIDFGYSAKSNTENNNLLSTVCGSQGYMAPELHSIVENRDEND